MAINAVQTHEEPRVVLSARGLTKVFGAFAAVKDVDLDVHHARVHALIGPNGAGKTTVFNLLTKFLQPSAGTINFAGNGHYQHRARQGGAHGAGALVPDFGRSFRTDGAG
jgi:ABC-type branched-subunit amino acid transport system ATPase component